MDEAAGGKAITTTRYPRLLSIVNVLHDYGKIVTSKADHYRHLLGLDPIVDAITITFNFGPDQTSHRTHKRARSTNSNGGSPQADDSGGSMGVGDPYVSAPDFESHRPKRIRLFYGYGKFADGHNATIVSRQPTPRVIEYRQTTPEDDRMTLSRYTCVRAPCDVQSLSPVPENPAALTPPQDIKTSLITSTCLSCDGTTNLENSVKLPCKHQLCKGCIASFITIRAEVSATAVPKCCGIPIPLIDVARNLPMDLFSRYLAREKLYNKLISPFEFKQEVELPAAITRSLSQPIDEIASPRVSSRPTTTILSSCTHKWLDEKPTVFGKCSHCGYNRSGGDINHHFIMKCKTCIFTACRRCDKNRSWE
jgi:hypothetical protein